MPEHLIPTLIFQLIIVGYTPGPANLFAFSSSIRSSKVDTLKSWLGLLCGFTVAMLTLTTLTHYLGEIMGKYVIYLKYAGGIYLIYLAYQLWQSSINMSKVKTASFINGFIIQMTNAKMMLFEMTIFSTFVLPYSDNYLDLLKTGCWMYIAGPLGNLFWIFMGRFIKRLFDKYMRTIDGICAILMVCCAVYLMLF